MRATVRTAAFLIAAFQASAQAPRTPHDRLVEAARHAAIDDPDLQPWQLKLDVTLYDPEGKNAQPGTIEAWHSGKLSKTIFTFGTSSKTILHTEDKDFEKSSGPVVSANADALLDAFLHPGPSLEEINEAQPDLRKEKFGKLPVDCIMLSQPIKRLAFAPMGLFPTYCLDADGTRLLATYNFGSQAVVRNGLGTFQGHQVSTRISLVQGSITVADGKVTELHRFVPTPETFQPDDSLLLIHRGSARVAGGVIAGAIIKKVVPIYPASARANRIGGAVILRATIGRDGHIHYLRPISAPDPDLAIAAIAAVRQWTYTPYLLNGFPTEVDTTITVTFNFKPF